ncbi:MAG: SRPBCC domain-containing protein [Gemmatimonadales bacterium]
MPEILHDFPVFATPERVFAALSDPAGLDAWWSLRASGTPGPGEHYALDFGPGYAWAGVVVAYDPPRALAWEMVEADDDWRGTRVGFELAAIEGGTHVAFAHTGWPAANAHFRTSSFCWAMYLRLFKRYVEAGEVVPYARRLDV